MCMCAICTYCIFNFERKFLKMTITVDTLIGDILDENAQAAAPILMGMGMHCLGCPSARGESIGEACLVHGVDADDIVKKLNAAVSGQ